MDICWERAFLLAFHLCCFTLCCLGCSFPVWCLEKDVEIDCIGSWSLPFHLLYQLIRVDTWENGTYHIDKQRRLRWACASARSRQNLRCLLTQSCSFRQRATSRSFWVPGHVHLKHSKPHNTKVPFLMRCLIYTWHSLYTFFASNI